MRKWIRLLSAGLLTLLLSGCMGAVPIDRRMLVQAVAIDWQDEQYQVTLQIFSPEGREGETGSPELCSVSGPDLEECVRSFRLETGQEPFLGNCRLVILGEAAARQQTGEIMDTLLSDHELRPGTPLCLTAGQAAGLLTRSAEELGELLQAAARAGRCPDSTLLTVVRSLESMGNTAAAARLEAADQEQVQVSGAMLLRSGQVSGLTPEQWRGISCLLGKEGPLEYTLRYKGGKLYTKITPIRSHLTGGEQPGELQLRLDLECTIQSYSGGTLDWNSTEVASVRAVAEQAVRREVERGFDALQASGSDVVCALETIRKFQPEFCRGRTPEEIFGSLVLRSEVRVNITALGAGAQASA